MEKHNISSTEELESDESESSLTKVVILGAGFGGLMTARALAGFKRSLTGGVDLSITLVDKNDYQLFTPEMYEIASASSAIDGTQQLKEAICVDVVDSLKSHDVNFLQRSVTGVDPKLQQVKTDEGNIAYDYLVIALGSEAFYFGIPGMEEYSVPMKTFDDALLIRSRVHELMTRKPEAHLIVCGGGPAGVELAAELRKACTDKVAGICPAITIVEGQDRILPMFSEEVSVSATKRLEGDLGIKLKTGFFIGEAKSDRVISKDGEEIVGDIIVWTGGVTAVSVLQQMQLELTKRKQIANRPTMQSQQYDNIFVMGDAAETKDSTGALSAMTAHEAVHQAPLVAKNIVALLSGVQLEEYKIKEEGYVITMGGKKGLVVLPSGRVISGYPGWFLRKFVDFRHFRSVLPLTEALSIWYRGARLMTKNDKPNR